MTNWDITEKQQKISENQTHEIRAGFSDTPQGWEAFPNLGWVSSDHNQIPLLKLKTAFPDKQVWTRAPTCESGGKGPGR